MKTKRMICIAGATLVLLSIIGISCSQQERTSKTLDPNQSNLIKAGEDFAFSHNACLAYIFSDLTETKTRAISFNSEELRNVIIESANNYIALNNEFEQKIKDEDFKITIEEIKHNVSAKELFYIEEAIDTKDKESLYALIEDVESDYGIDEDRKLAIICFITTLDASTQYWNKHLQEWFKLINRPQTRASIENIALADAWWGFQGMLMSGLNPIAGGGMAAIASAGAAIWGKYEVIPKEEQMPSTGDKILETFIPE